MKTFAPLLLPPLLVALAVPVPAAAQSATAPAAAPVSGNGEPVPDAAPPAELEILSAEGRSIEEFLWLKRPVIVFADSPADPRYVEQMQLLTARQDALVDRDVVVLTDTDPAGRSAIRTALRPRGFMIVVLAKDGSPVLRKPFPWDVRELSRSIDKLPLRQQEIRDRRDTLRR